MYKILICDDDKDIVSALRIYLNAEGYQTLCANNGDECLELMRNHEVNLVILDIMMPQKNGIETLSELRSYSNVPVIMLSAKSEDIDKISGLNIGADDYITKPFNPVELMARVKSQLRRYMKLGGGAQNSKLIKIGGLTLDDTTKSVMVDNELISLTPLEYEILSLLMKNAGKVFSPKEIYKIVWNETPMGAENAVAVHIRHIREKIEIDPAEPRYLKVVWGKGYKIQNET
ncbi:MAG: response regulator transcription factor [Oscillospiraceae bacterium]|nr:response regulator transcription factor [Oscillospiraceae bacterium]